MKDLFDYDVYDRSGEKVGSVENVWADEDKEIEFIGVRTGWLGFGKTHLIPAEDFTIDEEARAIRVPYDEDLIKGSPSFESTEKLGERVEADVYSHFGLAGHHPERYTGTRRGIDEDDDRFVNRTGSRDVEEGESVEISLAEERIHIEKRDRDIGEVRLRKVVRTETVNQPIEISHAQPGAEAFTDQAVTIPIREKEGVGHKTVEAAGSVKARKVVESEQENVQETVRKEDVEVKRTDDKDRVDRLNRE
jgi:stress response protein YsnF/sporulation protein YlmC with PRC-barrel domain